MHNVRLAYVLAFFSKAWFWLGIWVLYYLRFTNYAGLGILESVMIISHLVAEVPTGVVADLFGRKNTLILAFLCTAVGNVIMGTAPNFSVVLFSVFLFVLGASLYSGTMEALLYDSLLIEKKQKKYDKVIAHVSSIGLIASGVACVVGGFLYVIFPGLPFLLTAFFQCIGLLLCFSLRDTHMRADHFSFSIFMKQHADGFRELFKSREVRKQTLYILSISIFLVILYEVLNDVLAVEYGFKAQGLGIFIAVLYLVSAVASQWTTFLTKRFAVIPLITSLSVMIALSLIISPWLGIVTGGFILILRDIPHAILTNLQSIVINKNTRSHVRATTISAFTMLSSLPYALSAFFIGSWMDQYSARNVAAILGIVILGVVLLMQALHPAQDRQIKH